MYPVDFMRFSEIAISVYRIDFIQKYTPNNSKTRLWSSEEIESVSIQRHTVSPLRSSLGHNVVVPVGQPGEGVYFFMRPFSNSLSRSRMAGLKPQLGINSIYMGALYNEHATNIL